MAEIDYTSSAYKTAHHVLLAMKGAQAAEQVGDANLVRAYQNRAHALQDTLAITPAHNAKDRLAHRGMARLVAQEFCVNALSDGDDPQLGAMAVRLLNARPRLRRR